MILPRPEPMNAQEHWLGIQLSCPPPMTEKLQIPSMRLFPPPPITHARTPPLVACSRRLLCPPPMKEPKFPMEITFHCPPAMVAYCGPTVAIVLSEPPPMVPKCAEIWLLRAMPKKVPAPPPAIVAPTMPASTWLIEAPPIMFGASLVFGKLVFGSRRKARVLLTLNSSG